MAKKKRWQEVRFGLPRCQAIFRRHRSLNRRQWPQGERDHYEYKNPRKENRTDNGPAESPIRGENVL
jgi:hypothetical protein